MLAASKPFLARSMKAFRKPQPTVHIQSLPDGHPAAGDGEGLEVKQSSGRKSG